jgi:hypothetical protein
MHPSGLLCLYRKNSDSGRIRNKYRENINTDTFIKYVWEK